MQGRWMVTVRGARCFAVGNKSGAKNMFGLTENDVLTKAQNFILSGSGTKNGGSGGAQSGVHKSNDKQLVAHSSGTEQPKTLTNVSNYKGHKFAWGKVQKKGGRFEGWVMIRITCGPACPAGSGMKDFFGQTEDIAISKARNFVDSRVGVGGGGSSGAASSSSASSSAAVGFAPVMNTGVAMADGCLESLFGEAPSMNGVDFLGLEDLDAYFGNGSSSSGAASSSSASSSVPCAPVTNASMGIAELEELKEFLEMQEAEDAGAMLDLQMNPFPYGDLANPLLNFDSANHLSDVFGEPESSPALFGEAPLMDGDPLDVQFLDSVLNYDYAGANGSSNAGSSNAVSSNAGSSDVNSSNIGAAGSSSGSSTTTSCPICLESGPLNVTIVPCGHCFCHGCAKDLTPNFASPAPGTICPTCRGPAAMFMKLFM